VSKGSFTLEGNIQQNVQANV